MRIRLVSVLALCLAGAVFTALGLALVVWLDDHGGVRTLVADGAIAAVVQFGGTVLAFATALLVLYLERRHREVELKAEISDAHRRVADEVKEVMRGSEGLLEHSGSAILTLLPDDVWRTARALLTSAHRDAADPLDYALSDFYTRVNVLQVADRLRVQHVLAGGDLEAAEMLVRRDALALAPLGEHLLGMLEQAQLTVGVAARAVPD